MFPEIVVMYVLTRMVRSPNPSLPPPKAYDPPEPPSQRELGLRPRVMDDMLTLTEVPLAGVHLTALDNQVHAEILTRCFVSRYVVTIYYVRC